MTNNKKTRKLKIIKLGGSVFSEKAIPNSLHEEILSNFVSEFVQALKETPDKFILVHGGGSFGHPPASKYKLQEGKSDEVAEQSIGLSITQRKMVQVNSIIMELLLEHNQPAIAIQPSSTFIHAGGKTNFYGINHIETLLNLNILPVLYGDILLETPANFSILSGDDVIFHLCKNMLSYEIVEVIFCIEEDGFFIQGENLEKKLLSSIHVDKLEGMEFKKDTSIIDVTGGMAHKIHIIQQICRLGRNVLLINGTVKSRLYNALMGKKILSTRFFY